MSDVVLRKKKNADAQAAFRARRANYIATLEETVTTLESVVLQLQDSCRESRNEVADLRQQNNSLRLEFGEREKLWRNLIHSARKTGQAPDPDDPPPPPLDSPFLGHAQPSALLQQYPNGIPYGGSSQSTYAPASTSFGAQSSTVPFASSDLPSDHGASGSTHRAGRYAPYPYPVHNSAREQRWPALTAPLPNGDSIASPHPQSPSFVESPSLTSADMSTYPARFSGDEQKAALNSVLDTAPYSFPSNDRFHQAMGDSVPNSRSISPTTSSTPSSSTSMSLTSSFPFTFHEQSTGQDRTEFDYRHHSLPHCPEVTLHGGTADISLTGQASDPLRYRMLNRRPDSGADQHPQIMSPNENGTQHEQANGSSDGDQSFNGSRTQSRGRHPSSPPGSPSPGPAPISCTVAVIKAQAFGALRRTRAKTKRTSEGAARVTKGVLEARGIGIGGSTKSKRPRSDNDNEYDNTETP